MAYIVIVSNCEEGPLFVYSKYRFKNACYDSTTIVQIKASIYPSLFFTNKK